MFVAGYLVCNSILCMGVYIAWEPAADHLSFLCLFLKGGYAAYRYAQPTTPAAYSDR